MRQEGTVSGPWCVEEKQADRHRDSRQETRLRKTSPSAETISATAIGAAGGVVSGFIAGGAICEVSGKGGKIFAYDCVSDFDVEAYGVLAGTVLGGLAGGYWGHQNNRVVVTFGGSVSALVLGTALWLWDYNYADETFIPVVVLSTSAGGYLGHRLWKARETQGNRYSLSPYLHDEGSGLVLTGRF